MYILSSTLLSPLGSNKDSHLKAVKNQTSGLLSNTDFHKMIPNIKTYIGEIANVENFDLPQKLKEFQCRNNQLAWQALQVAGFSNQVAKIKNAVGAKKIGLVVGTSTSGIATTEQMFKGEISNKDFYYQTTHQMNSLAKFCSEALEITGPSFVISTACSSSAKVFSVAKRWLDADLVDAVVVGGVDSLCLTTIHGFNALGLISENICKPLDQNRNGINIGEAAGFMLLTKHKQTQAESSIKIIGIGESSDAHHISTPHPEGKGALLAMQKAIYQSSISIEQIDYLNLHGTATKSNDLSEMSAVSTLLSEKQTGNTWISSTKGLTGHTLGAAGITEIIFCQWMLEEQIIFPNLNLRKIDVEINKKIKNMPITIPEKTVCLPKEITLTYAMSNSFGFGGNNASVILKKENLA